MHTPYMKIQGVLTVLFPPISNRRLAGQYPDDNHHQPQQGSRTFQVMQTVPEYFLFETRSSLLNASRSLRPLQFPATFSRFPGLIHQ